MYVFTSFFRSRCYYFLGYECVKEERLRIHYASKFHASCVKCYRFVMQFHACFLLVFEIINCLPNSLFSDTSVWLEMLSVVMNSWFGQNGKRK